MPGISSSNAFYSSWDALLNDVSQKLQGAGIVEILRDQDLPLCDINAILIYIITAYVA